MNIITMLSLFSGFTVGAITTVLIFK